MVTGRILQLVLIAISVGFGIGQSYGQIVRDGSLGQTAGALSGPNFTIGVQNPGQQIQGNNLFHSFSDFNVQIGQSATFTGPSSIANIISRVTGQNLSTIDGLISSRAAMPSANFFLINPNGLVVGPHASFNVGGSVNLSTADYLRLTDGGKFFASLTKQSTLTSAPVTAFGFLGETPAKAITLQSDAGLTQKVPFFVESDGAAAAGSTQQQPLSLIGGDIAITGRTIATNGGQINLVSVASGGEVLPNAGPGGSPILSQVASRGAITLSTGATLDSGVPPRPNDPFDAAPSGNIFIRAGQLVMDRATITAQSRGWNRVAPLPPGPPDPLTGGSIDVEAESMSLQRTSQIRSSIFDQTFFDDVTTSQPSAAYVGSLFNEGLFGCTSCPITYFTIGEVRLKTRSLTTNGLELSAAANSNSGSPRAGNIFIEGLAGEADFVALSDTRISSSTNQTTFQGAGAGGTLQILAKDMVLDNTQLTASAVLGGPIKLGSSNHIRLVNSALFSSTTEGKAGQISLTAGNAIEVDGGSIVSRGNGRNSGDINIVAPSITVAAGNIDATAVQAPGSIVLSGENITLTNAASLSVNKRDFSVSAEPAGDISLRASDSIRLNGGSRLESKSPSSSGGNIILLANNLIYLRDSQITTSVTSTTGNGGNVIIDPPAVVLQNSNITANALQGRGGTISIVGNVVLLDPTSSLNASAGPAGVDGQINIQAPLQQLAGAIAPLPQAFAVSSNLYGQRCAAQKGGQFSSFVQGARDGIPPQPGDLLASPLALDLLTPLPSGLDRQAVPKLAGATPPVPLGDEAQAAAVFTHIACGS
jgi:filamentous hemagglutinin family protein